MVPPRSNVMPVASHYAESMCSVGACVVVRGGLRGRLRESLHLLYNRIVVTPNIYCKLFYMFRLMVTNPWWQNERNIGRHDERNIGRCDASDYERWPEITIGLRNESDYN